MSDQERLRRYVLGTLPEPEAEELEKRLLVDEELHERLEEAQDALVEDHLTGALAQDERIAFETRLALSPRIAQHVRHAELLRRRLTEPPAGRRRGLLPYWLAAAAALMLLATAAVLWQRPPAAPRTAGASSPGLPTASPTLAPPPPSATPGPVQPTAAASLTLSPGQTMSEGDGARIALTAATDRLRLELVMQEPLAAVYTAELLREDGTRAWRRHGVRRDGGQAVAILSIPTAPLSAGRYRLELTPQGGTAADRSLYYFEVTESAAPGSR